MTYFGTNLKKIRQIKGLSQQAFAELIDLNRGVISSYEEGRAEPKIETLLRIATYFGISTDDIISKPLTVNQLANFSLIEDSISTLNEEKEEVFYHLTSNGKSEKAEMQKIFAKFDFLFFVDESLASKTIYEKDTILFLKEIKNDIDEYNSYLSIENEVVSLSETINHSVQNFAIVGFLGNELQKEQNSVLQRLNLLEKKVFGKE